MGAVFQKLKELFDASPYAGVNVKQKVYPVTGTLTALNVTAPNQQYITIAESEYFWATGIWGSYFALAAPFTLGEIYFQITDSYTGESLLRTPAQLTGGGAPRPGFVSFNSVLEPGKIENPVSSVNHKKITGFLRPDCAFAPKGSIMVSVVGPAAYVQNIRFDIALTGFAVRLDN
jgi:hypothetical protein